jgi:hypothetical protein
LSTTLSPVYMVDYDPPTKAVAYADSPVTG